MPCIIRSAAHCNILNASGTWGGNVCLHDSRTRSLRLCDFFRGTKRLRALRLGMFEFF